MELKQSMFNLAFVFEHIASTIWCVLDISVVLSHLLRICIYKCRGLIEIFQIDGTLADRNHFCVPAVGAGEST